MANRIQYRRDTAARWKSVNPILLEGEVGYELDTKFAKVGDGVHAWNDLEYTLNIGNNSITNELGDSEKLVISQKALTKNFSDIDRKNEFKNDLIESNIKEKKQYIGWLDSSNTIIEHANSTFIIYKLNGGEEIEILTEFSNIYAFILSNFDFNFSLPYTPVFASGENGRRISKRINVKVSDDAKYLLIATYNSELGNLTPSNILINGYSVNVNIYEYIASINEEIVDIKEDINNFKKLDGHVNNDGRLLSYGKAKYIPIPVKGGDKVFIPKQSSSNQALAIVKNYTYNPSLPYNYTLADGEIGIRQLQETDNDFIISKDANYILLRAEYSDGTDIIPNEIFINGIDITKSLKDNLSLIKKTIENLEQKNEDLTQDVQDIDFDIKGINIEQSIPGHVDSSNKVVLWQSSKYIPIPVKGGDKVFIPKQSSSNQALAIVKNYTYNQTLPFTLVYASGETSLRNLSISDLDITIPEDATYLLVRSIYVEENNICFPNEIFINGIDITKSLKDNLKVLTEDVASIRNILGKNFNQLETLKIKELIIPNYNIGTQGAFTIDNKLYTCSVDKIFLPKENDIYGDGTFITVEAGHLNDADYCPINDTFLTSSLRGEDALRLLLLSEAKSKFIKNTNINRSEFLEIQIEGYKDEYFIASSCFGERIDIVYCILVDVIEDFSTNKKRLLKIKLGQDSNGVYDGTYEIIYDKSFPYPLEIQGSKYINGKLFVSTDSYINTPTLHCGITVIDLTTFQTNEYISYINEADKSKRIEAEGIAIIDNTIIQIVIIHGETNALEFRKYDIINL